MIFFLPDNKWRKFVRAENSKCTQWIPYGRMAFLCIRADKTNEKKLWTTGTDAEKKLITDKIQTALAWQQQTGIPTWVGAWMPGNYNKGNTYSVEEQTVFAGFMTKALSDAGIPFAVNADTKYYNAAENTWISSMLPVFKTIFQ